MRSLTRLGIGLLLVAFAANLIRADEPTKAQFQTIKLETLSKGGGQFDWSNEQFLSNVSKQGEAGWELLLTSERAALFRKTKDGPKWEYKSVKLKNSPFVVAGMKDTDAYALLLDRLASEGYAPCAVDGLGEYTLLKRAKDSKPAKTELETVLLTDIVKAKVPPASRWSEKEFIDGLNKKGADGWEVLVCNFNACTFRKSSAQWEYKTLKVTKSPLAASIDIDKDDEAATFTLILEGSESKGWKPCSIESALGQELLLKRESPKDKK
jgi:hypothetical protein